MSPNMEVFHEDYEHLRELVKDHSIFNRLPALTSALCIPGCQAGDNFMSIVKRIKVKVHENANEDEDEDEPEFVSLIVKRHVRASLRRQLFRFADIFLNEINSYNVVLQFLRPYFSRWPNPIIPDCYYAGRDNIGGIIILEDLLEKGGFTVCNRRVPINLDLAKRIVTNLARFHAASVVAKAEDPDGFRGMLAGVGDEVYCEHGAYLYTKLVRTSVGLTLSSLINCNANGTLARAIRITRRLYGRAYHFMRRCILRSPSDMSVICHGDMWTNNIMDNGRDMKFVDFQAIRYGSPVFDILHLMFTCARRPLRTNSTRIILETYCNAMADSVKIALPDHSENQLNAILEPFTIARISEEYYRNIAYGLGVAMWVLPAVTFDTNNLPKINDICDGPEAEIEILRIIKSKLTTRYHIRMRETMLEFIENGNMQQLLDEMEECGDFDIVVPVPLPPDLIDNDYLPFSPTSANGHAHALVDSDQEGQAEDAEEAERSQSERMDVGEGEGTETVAGPESEVTQEARENGRAGQQEIEAQAQAETETETQM